MLNLARVTPTSCRSEAMRCVFPHAFLTTLWMSEAKVKTKLIAMASWIGFLGLAASEYGCDVDFPLTPTLWLAIGICAAVVVTVHAAPASRTHTGESERRTYWSVGATSLSDSAKAPSTGNQSRGFADDCRAICEDILSVGDRCGAQLNSHGSIVMITGAMPTVRFLTPKAPRGPPPCCLVRHVCPTAQSSNVHLPSFRSIVIDAVTSHSLADSLAVDAPTGCQPHIDHIRRNPYES